MPLSSRPLSVSVGGQVADSAHDTSVPQAASATRELNPKKAAANGRPESWSTQTLAVSALEVFFMMNTFRTKTLGKTAAD
jgi:hypothetical protein